MRSSYADKLIGAIIGLARTTDGNEHLINACATNAILAGLKLVVTTDVLAEELEKAQVRIVEEKRKIVPDCFLCASPCGKNDDFPMTALADDEQSVCVQKEEILSLLCAFALSTKNAMVADAERLVYKALIAVGIVGIDSRILSEIIRELKLII